MAFSNPSTKAVGSVLTAANWNEQVANTDFLARPPSVSLTRTTEQALGTTAWRSVAWQSEGWDTDTMWSSTAPTRIDINTAGKYQVSANIPFTATAGNVTVRAGITVGGSTTAAPNNGVVLDNGSAAADKAVSLTRVLSLTSTQFVRINVSGSSGANAIIMHSSVYIPSVSVLWVSS